jgi:hypothetical protein
MISYLGSLLKEKATDEEFRIAKAAAKREAQLFQEELFKNLKQQKDIQSMNEFRKETVSLISLHLLRIFFFFFYFSY